MEYQLLADVVAKSLIVKASVFAALTVEKFQVMTVIIKSMKINCSSILFNTLKNMVQHSKQSFDFAIRLSKLLEDLGIPLNAATPLHKYKMLNDQSIVASRPKGQALNISPAGLLAVNNWLNRRRPLRWLRAWSI